MMAAERGSSLNTLEAYRRDLLDFAGFALQKSSDLLNADTELVRAYLQKKNTTRRLCHKHQRPAPVIAKAVL